MDFVINNYIIFIVVGVILLMALIGYIADNTNFEKKPKKTKKDKKEKNVQPEVVDHVEEIPVEAPLELETIGEEVIPVENTEGLMNEFEIPTDLNEEAKIEPVEVVELEQTPQLQPEENTIVSEVENKQQDTQPDDIWKF